MVSPDRPDPAALVARWRGAPGTLAHVRDGENAVYRFAAGRAPLILRLTEARHRSRAQLAAELEFIRFVAARGVRAARPLPSAAGEWVEAVTTPAGDQWHAVAFEAAPGRHFEYRSADVDRPLFHAWGRAMGALHAASREFQPVGPRRVRWAEQDGTRLDVAGLPPAEAAAHREHARVAEWLASLPAPDERSPDGRWGLVHGDFERTNFVLDGATIDGATLRVYDFDDACYHWYVADVAHALWAFRGAPAADRRRFLAWFLEGYRERCVLDEEQLAHFSWFVRLRSLSLFAGRVADAAALGAAADGPWEGRMRAAFEEPFQW